MVEPQELKDQRIQGVFSSQMVEKVGTGTTSRKSVSKTYWYAEEREDGVVLMRPLNKSHVPSGEPTEVPKEDFLAKYEPELEFYQQEVYPRMRELEGTLKRAEEQRAKGALYSAEFEYDKALAVDEDNVRANFGLGLTYMDRGETGKANDIFGRVVGLDAAFGEEHKHLFNEFGISLRKSGMGQQAVEYYERALKMTDDDENLHYNMARAYYDAGEPDKTREQLARVLELDPDHEEARKFLDFLDKNKA